MCMRILSALPSYDHNDPISPNTFALLQRGLCNLSAVKNSYLIFSWNKSMTKLPHAGPLSIFVEMQLMVPLFL